MTEHQKRPPEWKHPSQRNRVPSAKTEAAWEAFWEGKLDGLTLMDAAKKTGVSFTYISAFRKAARFLPHKIGEGAPCSWGDVPKKKKASKKNSYLPDVERMEPLCSWIKGNNNAIGLTEETEAVREMTAIFDRLDWDEERIGQAVQAAWREVPAQEGADGSLSDKEARRQALRINPSSVIAFG
ncbi:hypothetical protein [Thioalkalivibrio sp. ALgr3]|uniref:hypothetical protein n=1 Tax=Thioalkalivibrio sp. ALgr3 TaxID=1239292 RepID=UPI0012DBD9E8|nr:hypothetical protein [Thioalkalivibrio sp. ALgr3]